MNLASGQPSGNLLFRSQDKFSITPSVAEASQEGRVQLARISNLNEKLHLSLFKIKILEMIRKKAVMLSELLIRHIDMVVDNRLDILDRLDLSWKGGEEISHDEEKDDKKDKPDEIFHVVNSPEELPQRHRGRREKLSKFLVILR